MRIFATSLRGEYGLSTDVEVSAVSALEGDQPCLGFTLRNVGKRPAGDAKKGRELPRSVEELTELIGRVPLKDLVRETTDVIERMCIEAALQLTGDNRATAAEILGLSRQSFYAKLRRYGLGDLDGDDEKQQRDPVECIRSKECPRAGRMTSTGQQTDEILSKLIQRLPAAIPPCARLPPTRP